MVINLMTKNKDGSLSDESDCCFEHSKEGQQWQEKGTTADLGYSGFLGTSKIFML